MLRIHCMQHWYNLSDGAMEDALYEIASAANLPDYPWIAPCRIAPPS
jgi:IS5 family transposase